MTKKEKMELAQIIAEAVVGALKEVPTSGKKKESKARGNAKTEETKELKTKYSTSLKDYEPKKGNDGHYIWALSSLY